MSDKMDKSLDDLIAEQRTKSKPRSTAKPDHKAAVPKGSARRASTRPDSRREPSRRAGAKQDAAGPPPRDPAYYLHDDRDGGFAGREQQGGVPRGSWKQPQQQWERQQQYERPRGRGAAAAAAAAEAKIITTADGWEEVAQDEPYSDRRGPQRRGVVYDRMSRGRGGSGGGYDRREEQQYGGGRSAAAGAGAGGVGAAATLRGEPRRRYVDEHDHREDAPAGPPGRAGRFQPYRVAGGGVSKRSSRGPAPAGRRWGHDLFVEDPEGGAAEEGGDYGGEVAME